MGEREKEVLLKASERDVSPTFHSLNVTGVIQVSTEQWQSFFCYI